MIIPNAPWLGGEFLSWHKIDGVNLIILKHKDGWVIKECGANKEIAGPYNTSTEAKAVYELFKYDYPHE